MEIFSLLFWDKQLFHKDILKLSDLYDEPKLRNGVHHKIRQIDPQFNEKNSKNQSIDMFFIEKVNGQCTYGKLIFLCIQLLNNKFHGLSPSGGHHSLLFDQGFQKMAGWD